MIVGLLEDYIGRVEVSVLLTDLVWIYFIYTYTILMYVELSQSHSKRHSVIVTLTWFKVWIVTKNTCVLTLYKKM